MGAISKFAVTALHHTKNHAPTILTVAGITGGVVAAVLGAKAALKTDQVLIHHETAMETSKELEAEGAYETNEDKIKHRAFIYVTTIKGLAVLYWPALTVGAVSAASILWGHGIMKGRNAALVTAYATLDRSFAAYRDKVRQSFPDSEFDRELASGISIKEDEETKEKTVVHNQGSAGIYTRLFDKSSRSWEGDRDYNMYFLKAQESIFQNQLASHGHVFLNDVLSALGFPHTPEGAIAGWIYDSEVGDGYIDFGLDKLRMDALPTPELQAFMRGEAAIPLEFNVDGVIYDRI